MLDLTQLLFAALAAPYMIAVILYAVRAVKGPTIPDIVLAVDCISYDLAVFLALYSVYYQSPLMIAPAILLSLWAYLLDVFASKYLVSREVGA